MDAPIPHLLPEHSQLDAKIVAYVWPQHYPVVFGKEDNVVVTPILVAIAAKKPWAIIEVKERVAQYGRKNELGHIVEMLVTRLHDLCKGQCMRHITR